MAKVHFLNVEEGDCSIIQHENGNVSMIDVCCAEALENALVQKALSANESLTGIKGNFNQKKHSENPFCYLQSLNEKTIFRYIQTHPDMDHMDGLEDIANNFEILNFWDTANKKIQSFDENGKCGKYKKSDWDKYQELRKSVTSPKALIYYDGDVNKYYAEDDSGRKTDDYLQILAPTKELIQQANYEGNWNDGSYVILYQIYGRKILFMGDAGMRTINHLLEHHKKDISNLDVLIAPHHGRDSGKDFSFLDNMNPKITLFGNAKSKDLAYDAWNSRDLIHITNNQAGNILLDISSTRISLAVSNQTFANKIMQMVCKQDAPKYPLMDYWFAIGF
jgi:beta-lactamase superfamily II metal-dependent hydrolase